MSRVLVLTHGCVIEAVYTGAMTMDLVKESEARIEAEIPRVPHPVILYNTLSMDPPTMALAREMKAFDARIQPRILRSATAVREATTAFLAKVAFVLSRDHRVFYNDRGAAYRWLIEAVQAVQGSEQPVPSP